MSFTVRDAIKLQHLVRDKQITCSEDFSNKHLTDYVHEKLQHGCKVSRQADETKIRAFFKNPKCRGFQALHAAIAEFGTYKPGAPEYTWLRSPPANLEEKLAKKKFGRISDPVDGETYFSLPNGSERICGFQPFRDTCVLDSITCLLKSARSLDGGFLSCDSIGLKELTFPESKNLLEAMRLREMVIQDVYPTTYNNAAGRRTVSCISTLRTVLQNAKFRSSCTKVQCEACGQEQEKDHVTPRKDNNGKIFQSREISCPSCDEEGATEVQSLKSILMIPAESAEHMHHKTISGLDLNELAKKPLHKKLFRLAGAVLFEKVKGVGHFTTVFRKGQSWVVADDSTGTTLDAVKEPMDARLFAYAQVQK